MSMPTSSAVKALIVHRGDKVNAPEREVHYPAPGEKTQDAVSNPRVRSGEMQPGNVEHAPLWSKTAVSENRGTLIASSRPVISGGNADASAAKPLKQPTEALFHNVLEMDKADFFGTDGKKIAQALQGFDINIPVKNNMTLLEAALFASASGPDGMTVVQALIEMGARFDLIAPDRPGVLQGAIKSNNIDLVKSLISRGKGKNSEEMHQALHYAVLQCEPKLALAIIKSIGKIDPSLVDVSTLFSKAVVLYDLELVRQIYFLAGPDINKPGFDGSTALAYAATYMAAPSIIEFLLSNGAQVNGKDEDARSNAVAAALIGINERRFADLDDEEIRFVKQQKLQTLQIILSTENASVDFGLEIPEGRHSTTLFDLAAKAGPEFVSCLAEAQLRQASKRTGVPSSTGNFTH